MLLRTLGCILSCAYSFMLCCLWLRTLSSRTDGSTHTPMVLVADASTQTLHAMDFFGPSAGYPSRLTFPNSLRTTLAVRWHDERFHVHTSGHVRNRRVKLLQPCRGCIPSISLGYEGCRFKQSCEGGVTGFFFACRTLTHGGHAKGSCNSHSRDGTVFSPGLGTGAGTGMSALGSALAHVCGCGFDAGSFGMVEFAVEPSEDAVGSSRFPLLVGERLAWRFLWRTLRHVVHSGWTVQAGVKETNSSMRMLRRSRVTPYHLRASFNMSSLSATFALAPHVALGESRVKSMDSRLSVRMLKGVEMTFRHLAFADTFAYSD